MLKVRIVYATRTKHSQKLAEAIGGALHIKAENIMAKPEPADTGLLFVVGGIYGGVSMPELLDYVGGLKSTQVKAAALVTSCASGRQSQMDVRKRLEEKGIPVIGEFVCKGGILFAAARHPNAQDLKNAADFAKQMVDAANANK